MPIGWIGWIGTDQFIGDGDLPYLPTGQEFLTWDAENGAQMTLAWDDENGSETLIAWDA